MKRKYRQLIEWATLCKNTVLYPISMENSELGKRAEGLGSSLVAVLAEIERPKIKKIPSISCSERGLTYLLGEIVGVELDETDARVVIAISQGLLWSDELDEKIRALAREVEEELALYRDEPGQCEDDDAA